MAKKRDPLPGNRRRFFRHPAVKPIDRQRLWDRNTGGNCRNGNANRENWPIDASDVTR